MNASVTCAFPQSNREDPRPGSFKHQTLTRDGKSLQLLLLQKIQRYRSTAHFRVTHNKHTAPHSEKRNNILHQMRLRVEEKRPSWRVSAERNAENQSQLHRLSTGGRQPQGTILTVQRHWLPQTTLSQSGANDARLSLVNTCFRPRRCDINADC